MAIGHTHNARITGKVPNKVSFAGNQEPSSRFSVNRKMKLKTKLFI